MAEKVAVKPVETKQAVTWQPRIIGFLCYWCSYTGADMAGTCRMKYPANVDIIRLMCSGRIDPELITTAFAQGADGVLVCGCHIGDCHYIAGNHRTMARMPLLRRIFDQLGIAKERFRHEWVSAAEGEKFAEIVRDMTNEITKLGPLNLPQTMYDRGVGHGMDLKPWGEQ